MYSLFFERRGGGAYIHVYYRQNAWKEVDVLDTVFFFLSDQISSSSFTSKLRNSSDAGLCINSFASCQNLWCRSNWSETHQTIPPVRFQNVVRHHRSKLHWSLVHLETILHAYSCKLVTKFPGADWKQSRGKKRKSNFTLFFFSTQWIPPPPPFFFPFYKTVSA